jgi:hypothetical protein
MGDRKDVVAQALAMTWDWASFALGAVACVLSQVLWAACYTGGCVLRLLRKGHIADLLGTLIVWALVIAAVISAIALRVVGKESQRPAHEKISE